MKELQEYVTQNPHVQVVYFDVHGNWFLHKGRTIVSEKTRAEILGSEAEEPEASDEVVEVKKKKNK